MLSYCLKCRKIKKVKTQNIGKMCGDSRKSKCIKKQETEGLLSTTGKIQILSLLFI